MNSPFLRLCSFALILSAGLSSCQKEKNLAAEWDTTDKKEGDLDEPFILGYIHDEESAPVYPAFVVLVAQGSTVPLDSTETDNEGNFLLPTGSSGFFYMRIYQENELLYSTEGVNVTDSVFFPVTIPSV